MGHLGEESALQLTKEPSYQLNMEDDISHFVTKL